MGVETAAPFVGVGEVVGSTIPSGDVATVTHVGPYQQLCDAHRAIREWCATHGHALAGPNWEVYDHWQAAWNDDPSRIRTDVYYLVGNPAEARG